MESGLSNRDNVTTASSHLLQNYTDQSLKPEEAVTQKASGTRTDKTQTLRGDSVSCIAHQSQKMLKSALAPCK